MKGVIFLATPHQGAKLAAILQKILRITLNRKMYIEQLQPYSSTVEKLFYEFNRLEMSKDSVSFYESTGIGVLNHV